MTDEHNENRFRVLRAIHLLHWSEKIDEVPFSRIQEVTGFDYMKTLSMTLSVCDTGHAVQIESEDNRPQNRSFKLTKKGRAWVTRQ